MIPEIIQVFKTLLGIFHSEIASGRCKPEIMEASEVLFKVNESFFRSHRVEAPEKKTKESEKKEKEQEDQKVDTGTTGDDQNWGAPDSPRDKPNNNDDLTNFDPEVAGHEAAVKGLLDEASKNQELMAAEDPREQKDDQPDGDGDTEELGKIHVVTK